MGKLGDLERRPVDSATMRTYKVAQRYDSYDRLIPRLEMMWGQMTPDGARWMDGTIDTAALDEMLADL
jgi:hypothetical protein